MKKFFSISSLFSLLLINEVIAQKVQPNLVHVDGKGVLRYTKDKSEAAFFGVNYTVPFAYGFRSHKALGIDPEKAIDADVYHMARLGLDAFRVHVWDVEISDSLGNLLQNEHLRLFDYLVQKLKQHNIKILITPIAFWGSGYPEPDVKTIGFSSVYGKGPAVVREEAIKAQENYLRQFFRHVNPYTKMTYTADPDVIAMEINNEPHHSGPKEKTTDYINRLAAAVRSTGWTKPIFYNISESPAYAGAVAKANVDGHSFQWYPTGLVAGHEQKGNFLPNVDHYRIPFSDSLPTFRNRARMVYEFDAADVLQPVMYPAMVRSFRAAGFQWATQFAYDPMATAYGNTEYQTHYLNLAYTPAKAISLLIAAKAFHRLPRGKSYGTYPADTLFDVFRVSYREQLSEMNSEEEFYYSNSTSTQPKNVSKLKHIAGVGSSPVVRYEGTGAYFLDKVATGVWRLEVMPDAICVRDPFEKASSKKAVTLIQWQKQTMQVNLPGLGETFSVKGINAENEYAEKAGNSVFSIKPGIYLLVGKGYSSSNDRGSFGIQEFYAPSPTVSDVVVVHQSFEVVTAGTSPVIQATVTGIANTDQLLLEIRNSANQWKTVRMQQSTPYRYKAEIPAEMMTPGLLNYRMLVQKAAGDTFAFPGGFKGNPYAWDEYRNETWQTFVAASGSKLSLFNPTTDRSKLMLYNPDWRNNTVEYITAEDPYQLVLKVTVQKPAAGQVMGWQFYFSDKIAGRRSELSSCSKIVIRARAAGAREAKLSLITKDAAAYAAKVPLSGEWKDIEIPLGKLQPDSLLLLPRPYPGFQPLYFKAAGAKTFSIDDAEKLEISFGNTTAPASLEVEGVWLMR